MGPLFGCGAVKGRGSRQEQGTPKALADADEHGEWSMANGPWPMAHGPPRQFINVHQTTKPSIHQSINPSIRPSVHQSIHHPSIHPIVATGHHDIRWTIFGHHISHTHRLRQIIPGNSRRISHQHLFSIHRRRFIGHHQSSSHQQKVWRNRPRDRAKR